MAGSKFISNMVIPYDTKLCQLYKALILRFGCGYKFTYDNKTIDEYDQRVTSNLQSIQCYEYDFVETYLHIFGKIINLTIVFNDNKGNSDHMRYQVGIHNSTKKFVKIVESQRFIKVKSFYLGNKMINLDEEKSFYSLGIKEDIDGIITYDDNKY